MLQSATDMLPPLWPNRVKFSLLLTMVTVRSTVDGARRSRRVVPPKSFRWVMVLKTLQEKSATFKVLPCPHRPGDV